MTGAHRERFWDPLLEGLPFAARPQEVHSNRAPSAKETLSDTRKRNDAHAPGNEEHGTDRVQPHGQAAVGSVEAGLREHKVGGCRGAKRLLSPEETEKGAGGAGGERGGGGERERERPR